MDLDATVKEKITVHAGGVIRIIAYVSGKPAPEIIWNKDDGDMPKEAVVETTAISSSLVIKNCKRQQQGIYNLTAKNEGGERKKAIIVEVLGEYSVHDVIYVIDFFLAQYSANLYFFFFPFKMFLDLLVSLSLV